MINAIYHAAKMILEGPRIERIRFWSWLWCEFMFNIKKKIGSRKK